MLDTCGMHMRNTFFSIKLIAATCTDLPAENTRENTYRIFISGEGNESMPSLCVQRTYQATHLLLVL